MSPASNPIIRINFESLRYIFKAKKWPIPDHSTVFSPLPIQTLLIPAKKCLLMNEPEGDRRPRPFALDDARIWGLEEEGPQEVVFARASNKYCLRMIFNAQRTLENLESNPANAYDRLMKDAVFHSDHLEGVQGLPVPKHYGMWIMNTGDWAGMVLFSLTQFCGVAWNELQYTKFNTLANRISVARTYEKLHDFGFQHGAVKSLGAFRHVLVDLFAPGLTEQDALNGKAPCYIVGFAEASANHQCRRTLPVLPYDACPLRPDVCCDEITSVLFGLDTDMMLPFTDKSVLLQALEWYRKNSHRFSSNWEALVEQRKLFYRKYPPPPSTQKTIPLLPMSLRLASMCLPPASLLRDR
ncbi:hypothetical protein R3P38DRAFT_3182325 [Favolaschia claudopus]|uniref:Uncharacterized protein n=1 Tax=Favolaschia claudopus TaxID=2862362 RepID=A0AAW0CGS7_9AGAR